MAIRITIEKVDDGLKDTNTLVLKTAATTPDVLPIQVVVANNDTDGIAIQTLKFVLGMAVKGKMNSGIATAGGAPLQAVISSGYTQHVNPIV